MTTTLTIGEADQIDIQGAFACKATFRATDYGPVGFVDSVAEGCSLQPSGTKFVGGDFGAKGFAMAWQPLDNPKCTITDDWTMTKH